MQSPHFAFYYEPQRGGKLLKREQEKKKIPIIFPTGSLMRMDGGLTEIDPDGSYTGVCADPYEKPVQDVDDL